MKKVRIILVVLFYINTAAAQDTSFQNLYFIEKGEAPVRKENDYEPRKTGFYLYRNCIYNLVLKNKLQLSAKITAIKNDSIYYTLHFNRTADDINRSKKDTFSLHPSQISKIRLIGDRIMGLYSGYSLRHFKYIFEQSAEPKKFDIAVTNVYYADSSQYTPYELVPYMTLQGVDLLYEQCGVTYYFQGMPGEQKCADTTKKILAKKKGVWFTPSNTSEITGVNLGLQTTNFQDEPLTIKGVNLNADVLSFFIGAYGLFSLGTNNSLINMPDTIDRTDVEARIYGLSLSAGGLAGSNYIKGVSINGGICTATEMYGLVITGSQNVISDFRGVAISLLRNLSVRGAGLQIGLLNICKHMKGVQIGLWNVNSKRKLPFINWSF